MNSSHHRLVKPSVNTRCSPDYASLALCAGIKRVVPGSCGRGADLVVPLGIVPVTGPLEGHAIPLGSLNPSQKV